ncbi:MAG: hypothetical protein JWO03_2427 [Bacteroidetes bacterium]|nr:hypothetical protein [Bacteroidota bacterium]
MRQKLNIVQKTIMIFCIATASVVAMSFSPVGERRNIKLHIWNNVGGKEIIYDNATYKNSTGQDYTITNLKYYISNITLTDTSGKVFTNKDSYYLIRQDDPATMDIELADIPMGNYKSISFLIGVDSLHNCSGAQSGALDPVNAMFWTWNTGYIFFKLEGKSPVSTSPGGIFEYHIGGYKAPANCIRKVTLDLNGDTDQPNMVNVPTGKLPDGKQLKISSINLSADIAKIMDGKTVIDIAKLSSVTDFRNAPAIADNYQHMFSLSNLNYDY